MKEQHNSQNSKRTSNIKPMLKSLGSSIKSHYDKFKTKGSLIREYSELSHSSTQIHREIQKSMRLLPSMEKEGTLNSKSRKSLEMELNSRLKDLDTIRTTYTSIAEGKEEITQDNLENRKKQISSFTESLQLSKFHYNHLNALTTAHKNIQQIGKRNITSSQADDFKLVSNGFSTASSQNLISLTWLNQHLGSAIERNKEIEQQSR